VRKWWTRASVQRPAQERVQVHNPSRRRGAELRLEALGSGDVLVKRGQAGEVEIGLERAQERRLADMARAQEEDRMAIGGQAGAMRRIALLADPELAGGSACAVPWLAC
jgi:hypothetical protein